MSKNTYWNLGIESSLYPKKGIHIRATPRDCTCVYLKKMIIECHYIHACKINTSETLDEHILYVCSKIMVAKKKESIIS